MSSLDQLNHDLESVGRDVPFLNVSSTCLAVGQNIPFGGRDCVGQARELASRCTLRDLSPRFVAATEPRNRYATHRAQLVEIEGQTYYLDPSLLHTQAIPLNPSRDAHYDAYPLVDGQFCTVHVSPVTDGQFSVQKFWPGDSNPKESHVYEMRTLSHTLPNDDDFYYATNGREKITIHCLDRDNGLSAAILNLKTRMMHATQVGGRVSGVQRFRQTESGFPKALDHVAATLQMTREELTDFVHEAADTYMTFRRSHWPRRAVGVTLDAMGIHRELRRPFTSHISSIVGMRANRT